MSLYFYLFTENYVIDMKMYAYFNSWMKKDDTIKRNKLRYLHVKVKN